jgi:hypothetical protein
VIDRRQIHCKHCNRLMKKIYYRYHKGSKFHKFYMKYPQFRPHELKRQRKLSEGQLLNRIRVLCDVCNINVCARYEYTYIVHYM